jgi:ankyrin repeat domain-containing protein 50
VSICTPEPFAEIDQRSRFRWVVCQLDALKRCPKVSLIRQALKSLPSTLDDTYTRLFLEIDEAYRNDAKNALLWLAFSERSLQINELAEATVLNPESDLPLDLQERFLDPQCVIQILSSLVTVSSDREQDPILDMRNTNTVGLFDMVTLAHFSVKEYLISERIQNSQAQCFAVSKSAAHCFIAKCCILYILQYAARPDPRIDLHTFPLAEYAAKYWHKHVRQTSCEDEKLLTPLVLKLLRSKSSISGWRRICRLKKHTLREFENFEEYPEDDIALSLASDMGLPVIVQNLLDGGCDPNAALVNGLTPLLGAARRGHENVVTLLLKYGAEANVKDLNGWTPLHHAVVGNHSHMVEALLNGGAEVGSADDQGWTPLHFAAYYGFENIACLLLKRGAPVEATMKYRGQTPLHWAAYMEHPSLLDLLIQHGANVNTRNTHGETALHWAAKRSYRILQQLLENGANPEIQTNRGETPLHWAATEAINDSADSAEALLKAGASIEVAIILSAKQESHPALHLLLSLGPTDTDSVHKKRMALEECARRGYELCGRCWNMLL